jgi:hypothetical protein
VSTKVLVYVNIDYNVSTYNFLVDWESGNTTYDTLVSLTKRNLCHLAKNNKKVEQRSIRPSSSCIGELFYLYPVRMVNQVDIDLANGNSKWQDSEAVEMGR